MVDKILWNFYEILWKYKTWATWVNQCILNDHFIYARSGPDWKVTSANVNLDVLSPNGASLEQK